MYSKTPQQRAGRTAKKFSDLTSRQKDFLLRIGMLIPALLRAVARGASESRWILGRRRLKDGRAVELSLVAKAQRPNNGGYSPGGIGNTGARAQDETAVETAHSTDARSRQE